MGFSDMKGFANAGIPSELRQGLHYLRSDLSSVAGVTQIALKAQPYEGTLRVELTHSGYTKLLVLGTDYTVSGLTITLTSAMINGDVYAVSYWSRRMAPTAAVLNVTLYAAILAMNPYGFWTLEETSGNFIDQGSGGHDLTPAGSGITRGVASIIPTETSAAEHSAGGGTNINLGTIGASVLPIGAGQSATFLMALNVTVIQAGLDNGLFWQGNAALVGSGEGGGLIISDTTGTLTYKCYDPSAGWVTASAGGVVSIADTMLIGCVIDATAHTVEFYQNGSLAAAAITGWTYGTGSHSSNYFRLGEIPGNVNGQPTITAQGAALWTSALSGAQMLAFAQAGGFA